MNCEGGLFEQCRPGSDLVEKCMKLCEMLPKDKDEKEDCKEYACSFFQRGCRPLTDLLDVSLASKTGE